MLREALKMNIDVVTNFFSWHYNPNFKNVVFIARGNSNISRIYSATGKIVSKK